MLFVGDDWAEDHHDVEVVEESGRRLMRKRFPEGVAGFAGLHALIADSLPDDAEPADVVIGIETDRGPWVTALIAAGYRVFAINPMQAARYRERYSTSGAKSDRGDAHVFAEIVRLDRAHHRQIAGDSDLSEAVKVLARGHQYLIWTRQRQTNQLRSMLREYYPAALVAFPDLAGRDALAVLAAAPTPAAGQTLTLDAIITLLRQAGRQRNLENAATKIHYALHAEHLTALPLTTQAFGMSARALITVITALSSEIAPALAAGAEEGRAVHEGFTAHGGSAALAGQTLLPVHRERPVEVARLAVHVDVQRVEGRAARAQCFAHHVRGGGQHLARLRGGQAVGGAGPVQPRPPQGLVRVDVADARHQVLVEQCPLDLRVFAPQRGDHRALRERRVHGVACDVGDGQRQQSAVYGHQFVHQQTAERALVHEPQLRAVVGEAEPHAQVLLVRGTDRLDQHLAAHAQVGQQREVLIQFGPQVLAAPADRDHLAAG